ncbi:MAG: D-glycero-beta-D-manno-heptose-7-phosphate kinase [Rhodospirillaceae bacterium]|nr:D-glycero-beta-D-manno-heptose-7-phosphate kinase [Rhodospirillaceae bacterium]|tara:strand:+ start:2726 stop:4180 length:1455 start_codon:yes stop_codon:yes gene_type:complete
MVLFDKYIIKNSNFDKVKILCIGDIILDRFISGEVDRVSPEAPIPIINVQKNKDILGGVGNVVANISSLGAYSEVISCIGDDPEGLVIKNLVNSLPNTKSKLYLDKTRISTSKERYVSGSQHLLRVDREDKREIDKKLEEKIKNSIKNLIGKFDIIILSDYGKGFLTKSLTKEIIKNAKKKNISVIVDPNGNDYSKYYGCDIITPNKLELSLASNIDCHNDKAINKAAKKIQSENKINYILVTRSDEGMSLFKPSGRVMNLKSEAKEVYDVSGAGDTVVATLAIILGTGGDIESASTVSNCAAGIVIAKFGTSVLRKSDLLNVTSRYISKINNIENALEIISDWKKNNLSLGFTNGVFDILHEGHIASLSFCKDNCEKLIVALNSDKSVKALKGSGRPINNENFRSKIIALLEIVDLVIIFDESNPLKIIKKISPDFIFKGSDYSLNEIIGRNFIESYGGKVILTPYIKGKSSSKIIKKIQSGK